MSDTVLDFKIDAVLRRIEDLKYEKRQLQKKANANRQETAECKRILVNLINERGKELERSNQHPGEAD